MPAKKKDDLVFSYHVNVYEDRIEVKINNWQKAVPARLQRTFDAILAQWHNLRRKELHELRKKDHAKLVAEREKKPDLPEGAVPVRKEKEHV